MKFKYPKILGFIISVTLAYFIFSNTYVKYFISSLNLNMFGYLGSFIAGVFYTFGFTSPFSTGFFIDLNPSNIILAGILGGLGALLGDLVIFEIVRTYFIDEFRALGKEKPMKWLNKMLRRLLGRGAHTFLLCVFAIVFIASPLPDEAGITILAGLTKIHDYAIAIIGVVSNTIGILILLGL
ncbi:MAG: hypothetical protein ACPLXC_02820 [Candidatus Pacearchaeota archaeon]